MLVAHYPLDEDSGSTAYDATGNGYNGSVTGATVGATGLLGSTAYSFDGTDDYVDITGFPQFSSYTISAWANPDVVDDGNLHEIATFEQNNDVLFREQSGSWYLYQNDGGGYASASGGNPQVGVWSHVVGVWDGSTLYLYENGVLKGTGSQSGIHGVGNTDSIGNKNSSDGEWFDGTISDVRIYDRVLTKSEIQYLYDVGATGRILTATKTHGSAVAPDLTNCTFTLNSQSATVYVAGSPGTSSEEIQSADLVSGTTEYDLTWANTHTDFRIEVVADITDVTQRVEVDKIGLLA